jgi:imidazole glycerol-phosphate synthase subunit HisH
MTIGIVEYGMGNMYSLYSLFNQLEIDYFLSSDVSQLNNADVLILPGVGAFNEAMSKLEDLKLVQFIRSSRKPIIGICLGMQLFFESGSEGGKSLAGLGLIKGSVELMELKKLPHVGFAKIIESNLGLGLLDKDFYFTHSFAAERKDLKASYAKIEIEGKLITAAVQKANVIGFQFHPELSQKNGIKLFQQIKEWHIKD